MLAAREMHRGKFADRVHGHASRADDGGWWLQYWFFYLFNNKAFLGFGLHEGDWEMVQVRLDSDEQPQEMAFAQHTHGQRCAWNALTLEDEHRPVVFVARGSQASYPFAGEALRAGDSRLRRRQGPPGGRRHARRDRHRRSRLGRLAGPLGVVAGAQQARVRQPAWPGPSGQVGRAGDLPRGVRRGGAAPRRSRGRRPRARRSRPSPRAGRATGP